MKQQKESIIGTILTAAQWYVCIQALTYHKIWAWNVTVFLAWVLTIIIACAFATGYKSQDRSKYRAFLSGCSDFLLSLYLASAGHFLYASLTMLQQFMEMAIHSKPKKTAEAKTEQAQSTP